MIEEKTIIDQIEVARNGVVQVRFAILDVKDGVERGSKWHRAAIEPGVSVDEMLDAVNADITTRPSIMAPPVKDEKIDLLRGVVALAHTPEVIAAYAESLKRAREDAATLLGAKA